MSVRTHTHTHTHTHTQHGRSTVLNIKKRGMGIQSKRVRGKYLLKGREEWEERQGAKEKGEGKEGVKGSMVLFSGSSSAL